MEKCENWSTALISFENREIDIMGDISYTDERAQRNEAMGEEKISFNLSNMDIGTSDFKSLDGK